MQELTDLFEQSMINITSLGEAVSSKTEPAPEDLKLVQKAASEDIELVQVKETQEKISKAPISLKS